MSCSSCGKDKKIVARGWCRACYSRWYNKGTTAYSPKPEKVACSVGGCNSLVVAKGMCDKHYRRMKKYGDPDHGSAPDWGDRSKHPLYHSWKWMRRHKAGTPVCDAWLNDFWTFVFDVGERPSPKHKLYRADDALPLGPTNFVWKTSVTEKVDGEDEVTYRNRRQRVYRYLHSDRHRGYDLKKNYGVSNDEYDRMLKEQGGVCAICGEEERLEIKGKKVRLAIDHCHKTNKVRGLLCSSCNRGLGFFRDKPEALANAARYLFTEL